ncbi:MAG: dTDP-4-dehydrorhamnose 3,5-epimerase [Saprospiraceae bacterium]|nr:dTDP-4-dehydrorhamnose 3,5-epimerase [Saprospiraceae bacterium]MBK7812313.1 dTDP-4-dehydrorhamnose 3,5-epimerase [Saprospiraceae bacterium]MBK9632462.1 dTDP-4-dehydrorhamnose 3,5-epimerase [Saprospiraceae bacterium]
MTVEKTFIEGLYVIHPKVHSDERGYFMESYHQSNLDNLISSYHFVQDNEACSNYGVVRGLHYQLAPHAQTKLVRVISGRVIDVALDLRKDSSTYGKHFAIELTGENKIQLIIPKGFAHGYSVLEDQTIFFYKCDDFYHPSLENGINPLDPILNIDWGLPLHQIKISTKDQLLPNYFI